MTSYCDRVLILPQREPRTAAERLASTLSTALGALVASCTHCTCTKAMQRAGDLDPDCPGLARDADGCLTASLLHARLVLADGGIPTTATTRAALRRVLATAVTDLLSSPDFTDAGLAALAESISTAPVSAPASGRSWAA